MHGFAEPASTCPDGCSGRGIDLAEQAYGNGTKAGNVTADWRRVTKTNGSSGSPLRPSAFPVFSLFFPVPASPKCGKSAIYAGFLQRAENIRC